MVDFYQRRVGYRPKLPKIINLSMDLILTIFWICATLALAFQYNPCPIGGLNGWCDKRNSLLAFSVMAGAASLSNLLWGSISTCLNR
ncbi:hypothetical protein K502DRAFT_325528, partial [Neoconidiobolus thromboides FSU 785]